MTSSIGATLSGASGFSTPAQRAVVVAGERAGRRGDLGADFVGGAGHERGDRAGQAAAFVGIVALAVAHDERAEVGVAEAERAEDVRILRDRRGGIARVIDEDFLRGDEDADGGAEALDVERAVGLLELHQVERGEIARRVVEEEIFRARVGRVLPVGALAGVPAVDGVVELHAGVAANPGALGDLAEEVLRASSFRSACRRARSWSSTPCPRWPRS